MVTTATSMLDEDDRKQHLPHKGKKLLLFSDSRQRAARLSSNLKGKFATDEGRAMFCALHSEPFFKHLPAHQRTLDSIYPYLCLYAGAKRMNPLRDSTESDRSRMLVHTASLSTHMLIHFGERLGLGWTIDDLLKGTDRDAAWRQFVTIIMQRGAQTEARHLRRTAREIDELEDAEVEDFITKYTDFFAKKIENIQSEEVYAAFSTWSDQLKPTGTVWADVFDAENEFQQLIAHRVCEALDVHKPGTLRVKNGFGEAITFVQNAMSSQELRLAVISLDRLINDRTEGHIQRSHQICTAVLELAREDLISKEELRDALLQWQEKIMPLSPFSQPPRTLGGLILRWLGDGLFGLTALGLGRPNLALPEEVLTQLMSKLGEEDSLVLRLAVARVIEDVSCFVLERQGSPNFSTARTVLSSSPRSLFGSNARYMSFEGERGTRTHHIQYEAASEEAAIGAFLGGLREQLIEHLEWMDSDRRRHVIFDGFDKAPPTVLEGG